nr:N-acetylmuramoyl-L-alanine amidase [uncultured Mucilaginibacter sp.]
MKNKILNRLKKLISGSGALLLGLSLFSFNSEASVKKDTIVNNFKLKTIIIDAGHGAKAEGSPPGHYSPGASGTFSLERNVTLAIALKLQKAIEKDVNGVKAVLTRTTADDVSFERRAEIANANKGNLLISLHCNSLSDRIVRERVGTKRRKPVYRTVRVPDRSGKGVLMLIYGLHRSQEEENAIKRNQVEDDSDINGDALDPNDPTVIILTNEYKRKFRKQSVNIANFINDELVQNDGRRSEGLREQGLYILCHSAMPSVMIETGYINNPDEEEYLNSEDGQNEIVDSIVRAIKNYKNQIETPITN